MGKQWTRQEGEDELNCPWSKSEGCRNPNLLLGWCPQLFKGLTSSPPYQDFTQMSPSQWSLPWLPYLKLQLTPLPIPFTPFHSFCLCHGIYRILMHFNMLFKLLTKYVCVSVPLSQWRQIHCHLLLFTDMFVMDASKCLVMRKRKAFTDIQKQAWQSQLGLSVLLNTNSQHVNIKHGHSGTMMDQGKNRTTL